MGQVTRRRPGVVLLGALLASAAPAQPLDRVVAVVAGQVILATDVRAFLDLGLLAVDAGDERAREEAALTRLIERRLALDEVDRYVVSAPPAERIDRDLQGMRARFDDAAAFTRALAAVGLEVADIRQILRDNARLETYLTERFGSSDRLTDSELRAYYDEHPEMFVEDGRPLSFESARAAIRVRLWAELRSRLVDEWIAGLRRRADVRRFDR